jgi:arsenite-transporting ATPase
MNLLDITTRYVFFTGKGGVGKTSNACAMAVGLADQGLRVLLVSTDPASNLDQVLGVRLGPRPTAIAAAPGLFALNIDPEAAARAYRERVVGPYRGTLPDDAVRGMEEQLSGACTVEVAAFDEFTELLTADGEAAQFERVIFDTAPTGHTLRLLQLPAAWTGFLETNERGASCLGPAAGLKTQQERYAQAVKMLADPDRTTVVVVARPERTALQEADRTVTELGALGLRNHVLLVNGVFRATDPSDPLARAFEARGRLALADLPPGLGGLPSIEVTLRAHNVLGLDALRRLLEPARPENRVAVVPRIVDADLPSLSSIIDEFAEAGHGLVMVMGKGGVGKTTIAAAIAVELASRGLPVHLTTTDPAAHLAEALGGEVPSLKVSRIDPTVETEAYRRKVLAQAGRNLDVAGRALLEEDLRSPCTEEVAVFHAFSRLVFGARREIVVMDTAPTGHTLLLLDATGAYHREVLRTATGVPRTVHTPLMRLRDPAYTRILVVTLPETTPVTEAAQLQADLRRAGIEPFAWVVNASLAAAGPSDPVLIERAAAELEQIETVRSTLAARVAIVPWMPEEPRGSAALRRVAGTAPAFEASTGTRRRS